MPLWLIALLLGAGVVVVASSAPHAINQASITAVTKHALIAETDIKILRQLQDLLSHAGYFDLATLVKTRGDAFDRAGLGAAGYGSIQAPKTIAQPTDVPYYKNFSMQQLQDELAKTKANYATVAQTPYGLTHPAFLAKYASNIADLEAWIKSHGGQPQQQMVQQVQQLAPVMAMRV